MINTLLNIIFLIVSCAIACVMSYLIFDRILYFLDKKGIIKFIKGRS